MEKLKRPNMLPIAAPVQTSFKLWIFTAHWERETKSGQLKTKKNFLHFLFNTFFRKIDTANDCTACVDIEPILLTYPSICPTMLFKSTT